MSVPSLDFISARPVNTVTERVRDAERILSAKGLSRHASRKTSLTLASAIVAKLAQLAEQRALRQRDLPRAVPQAGPLPGRDQAALKRLR